MAEIDRDVCWYYEAEGDEDARLTQDQLELTRVQHLLRRYLPAPPGTVIDIGGGTGVHGLLLADRGYSVHLFDPVPLHIEQAKTRSASAKHPLASIELGSAAQVDRPDGSADAVLALGPLFHLPRRDDRLTALQEMRRILRPGGTAVVLAIPRFSTLLDGLFYGMWEDPDYRVAVRRTIETGVHSNPDRVPGLFTTAYFHRPEDLRREVCEGGFTVRTLVGVEGPERIARPAIAQGYRANEDLWWRDAEHRQRLLEAIELVESEEIMLGFSSHMLLVADAV